MSSLFVLAVVAFVIWYKAGPSKRADWKRQVERALEPELSRVREHPNMPERFRKVKPPAPTIIGRSTTPPPPTGRPMATPPLRRPVPPRPTRRPVPRPDTAPPPPIDGAVPLSSMFHRSMPPPPPSAPADPEPDETEIAVPEPATSPGDDRAAPVAPVQRALEDDDAAASADVVVDLDLVSVRDAVFGAHASPFERTSLFRDVYEGRAVTWTATVERISHRRRHREPATRVELALGFLSEHERLSERVVAEAYFPPDADIERGIEIGFTATLAEANVYARRLVLDDAVVR